MHGAHRVPWPHWVEFCNAVGKHWPVAVQHPSGQVVSSHTQRPPRQAWPKAHGPPPPHWHWPPGLHESPVAPQSTQAWPLPPQAFAARAVQVDPTQQPVAQLAAQPLHTPFEQVS